MSPQQVQTCRRFLKRGHRLQHLCGNQTAKGLVNFVLKRYLSTHLTGADLSCLSLSVCDCPLRHSVLCSVTLTGCEDMPQGSYKLHLQLTNVTALNPFSAAGGNFVFMRLESCLVGFSGYLIALKLLLCFAYLYFLRVFKETLDVLLSYSLNLPYICR